MPGHGRRRDGVVANSGMSCMAGPLELRNPVIPASCPLGGSPEGLRAACGSGAGEAVTKSITREPRGGNPEPNTMEPGN